MAEIPQRKSNQEEKFERDLLPHINALHTFAYHLAYDEESARDLVQETYLRAYKAISSYQEGTNAKAWLFKILKNCYINQYRQQSKRPVNIDYEEFAGLLDRENSSLNARSDLRHELFQHLLGDEVTMAINSLPVEFRTVILLCDVEGFTYEEIAKIIDVPIGTVRSRLHRARKTLKKQLQAYAEKMGYKDKKSQS
jgi:RNA polymerase sigma factor (sigma-70 family)